MPMNLMRICFFAVVMIAPLMAGAWEEPAHWADVGSVAEWKDYDAHFMRIEGLTVVKSLAQVKVDQQAEYQKTRRYHGSQTPLELDAFLALPAADQAERVRAAKSSLRRVHDFHNRILGNVMDVKSQVQPGWGIHPSDPKALGDCLIALERGVGLDPANPYAWHLIGYIAGLVGDYGRALVAFDGAEAALDQVPADEMTAVRGELALDRAWALRELGFFDQARESLDEAEGQGVQSVETRILRGLIAAQSGDMREAQRLAKELRGVEVAEFRPDMDTRVLSARIINPKAWPKRPSGFAHNWIMALAWLSQGDRDMAGTVFGYAYRDLAYPTGYRFWNDAARIYNLTGRRDESQRAWRMSQMTVPYFPFMVFKPYALDLSGLTGRTGSLPFILGFDSYFQLGSRFAYGASLIIRAAAAEDQTVRNELAGRGLNELEICVRTGEESGPAALLMGQAHALMGNWQDARNSVETAHSVLSRPGEDQTYGPMADELASLCERVLDGHPIESQSGRAVGRWAPIENLADRETELRESLAADPADAEARRELARFLIRNGEPEAGRELVVSGDDSDADLLASELVLVLEADRMLGELDRAKKLLGTLQNNGAAPWPDAELWTLVGFICLDHQIADGRLALEHAVALDPGNLGLQRHLQMTAN